MLWLAGEQLHMQFVCLMCHPVNLMHVLLLYQVCLSVLTTASKQAQFPQHAGMSSQHAATISKPS